MAIIDLFKQKNKYVCHLAKLYKESVLSPANLDEKKQNLENDARVTLVGHGSKQYFGKKKFTPEGLGDFLIKSGIKKQHVIIDLIGCDLGLTTDGESFAQGLLHYFLKQGYDVRINVFTNLKTTHPIAALRVAPSHSNTLWSSGIRHEKKSAFDEEEKKAINSLEENAKNLQGMIKQLKLVVIHLKSKAKKVDDIEADIASLIAEREAIIKEHQKKLDAIVNKVEVMSSAIFDKYATVLDATEDPRRTLDENRNYQFDKAKLDILRTASPEKTTAIILINDIIANMKNELFKRKNGLLSKLKNHDTSAAKINKYEKIAISLTTAESREQLIALLKLIARDLTATHANPVIRLLKIIEGNTLLPTNKKRAA